MLLPRFYVYISIGLYIYIALSEGVAAALYALAMTYRVREETRPLAQPLLERTLGIR